MVGSDLILPRTKWNLNIGLFDYRLEHLANGLRIVYISPVSCCSFVKDFSYLPIRTYCGQDWFATAEIVVELSRHVNGIVRDEQQVMSGRNCLQSLGLRQEAAKIDCLP